MKKIALTFILFISISLSLVAQTDKMDKLVEQMTELTKQVAENNKQQVELSKQMIELAKQQAVTNVEIKGLDKRFDTQTSYIVAVFAGIFAMMTLVMWDRRISIKPYEEKTERLQAEITLLKEK